MNPEEKLKWEARFKELTKHEVAFLKDQGIPTNEYGAYVFMTPDMNVRISLDMFLLRYKDLLIENNIVKEV